jgi:hypothetical protein
MASSTFSSNPYANFDPSQYLNPYSNYQSSALPAASYAGWPTDAMGNPIQPKPGMTLNSTPQQQQAPAAAPQSNIPQFLPYAGGSGTGGAAGGENAMGSGGVPGGQNTLGGYQVNPAYAIQQAQQQYAQQQAAPAAAPAPAANSAGLTAQQYMQLRANPGHVTTPGATVPQAPATNQSNGVLQQFLQNWTPATSGAGSGLQQGFSKALKGMGY